MKKRILALFLSVAMMLSFIPFAVFASETSATISFADKANRVSQNDEKQVWSQNGITVTNNRADSTSKVADTSNPVRFYKNSEVIIEYPGMTKIVIDCSGIESKNNGWVASVNNNTSDGNATAAKDGNNVVITFANPVNSFTITLTASQSRANAMTVYGSDSGNTDPTPDPEEPSCAHEKTSLVGEVAADIAKAGYSGDEVCDSCGETVKKGAATRPLEYESDSTITISQANALGSAYENGNYSTGKFYVIGEITNIANTMYGNMTIKDSEGNSIYVYGTMSADGSIRYDALEVKPVAGDTVKLYGVIGKYNGNPQIKEGWIVEHTPNENPTPDPEPEDPTPEQPEGEGVTITFDDVSKRTSVSTLQQVWVENGITVTNDKESGSNINEQYYNPIRLYKNASVTIAYPKMTAIVVEANSATYATALAGSTFENGATATADGKVVTITLASAVDSLKIIMSKDQVRVNKITVYAEKNDTPAGCEHDENDVIEGREATCTETGLTDGAKCSKCGEVQKEQEVIPAKGHTEETLPAVAPTCDATGLKEGKKCTVCNTVTVEQEVIPAKGHSYEATVTAPTCTDKGYTTHACACGHSYTDSEVDALGHDWEAAAGDEPTCTKDGYEESYCTRQCGVAPKIETFPATGHNMVAGDVVAPTCTEEGYTVYTCANGCGETDNRDTVAALGHTEVVDAAVEPTCTETGLTEGKHCSVCKEVIAAQTEVAAHGHDMVAGEKFAAEQFVAGYTLYTCANNCGTTEKKNLVMPTCSEVQNVEAKQITNTMDLRITWDALDGADKYIVYVYDATGVKIRGAAIDDGTRTSVVIGNMKVGNYTVKVRARVGSKYTDKYDAVDATMGSILPAVPEVTVTNVDKYSITVTWEAVPGAEKYFVKFEGGNQVFTPGTKENTCTITGLKVNTTYTISLNVKMGTAAFTGYVEKTQATTLAHADIEIGAQKTDDMITVSWDVLNDENNSADKYWVKRVDADGNVTQIAATTETSITAKSLDGANKFYIIARVKDKYDIYRYVTSEAVEVQ